jgi:ribosome maturation factor RimP
MSKIEKELVEATDLSTKRGESRQDFLNRLVVATTNLADKDWEKLSQAAQDWSNEAADAKNAKAKTLPDFPDAEKEEEAPTGGRRRAAAEEEPDTTAGKTIVIEPGDLKNDMPVTITTKRGKTESGHVVEVTKKMVAIKQGNGDEVEFDFDRIDKIETLGEAKTSSRRKSGDDEPDADPVKVGSVVTAVTKRGKEYTGKIVEVDEEILVLDVDGKEEELSRDRLETIKPAAGKSAPKDEEKTSSRRSSAKGEEKAKDDEKAPRSTNNGVSVGTRIKELIADNLDATEADIAKALKKEGLEFRDNTLSLNFKDCHKFIDVLKSKKMLKL